MILADWVFERRGFDPAAHWRGKYSTVDEYEAILQAEGGIEALMRRVMDVHSFSPVTDPKSGDIGLVIAPCAKGVALVGAIYAAPARWAVLTPDKGILIAPMPFKAAWDI